MSVTVVIPTFERPGGLARAARSVLAQDVPGLELVIADNASGPETVAITRALAEQDRRVRVLRHAENLGLTENFNAGWRAATGDYVMALADDDWLEPGYLTTCAARLDGDPGLVLVSGEARYWSPDAAEPRPGDAVALDSGNPARRVAHWYRHVSDNVAIYGLIRREALLRALPMRHSLAGDWLLLAGIATQGRFGVVRGTWLNRSAGGTSASHQHAARAMGLSRLQARFPHYAIAAMAAAEPYRRPDLYDRRRAAIAAAGAWGVLRNHPLELVEDVVGPWLGHPRLSGVDSRVRAWGRRRRGDTDY